MIIYLSYDDFPLLILTLNLMIIKMEGYLLVGNHSKCLILGKDSSSSSLLHPQALSFPPFSSNNRTKQEWQGILQNSLHITSQIAPLVLWQYQSLKFPSFYFGHILIITYLPQWQLQSLWHNHNSFLVLEQVGSSASLRNWQDQSLQVRTS